MRYAIPILIIASALTLSAYVSIQKEELVNPEDPPPSISLADEEYRFCSLQVISCGEQSPSIDNQPSGDGDSGAPKAIYDVVRPVVDEESVGAASVIPKDIWTDSSIRERIKTMAEEYGVNVNTALRIANCESGFNPSASNRTSTAKGVYQFLDGTWDYIGATGQQYDAEENIRMFMIWYPRYPSWWLCK